MKTIARNRGALFTGAAKSAPVETAGLPALALFVRNLVCQVLLVWSLIPGVAQADYCTWIAARYCYDVTVHSGEIAVENTSSENHLPSVGHAAEVCKANPRNPIDAPVSSPFGLRNDPFGPGTDYHKGIDLVADIGTPIPAPAKGVVTYAGLDSAGGKYVDLRHDDGARTRYAHLSRIDVRKNTVVQPGQIIGLTGNTGLSTGPHLHYEILADGIAQVDPLTSVLPTALAACTLDTGGQTAMTSLIRDIQKGAYGE